MLKFLTSAGVLDQEVSRLNPHECIEQWHTAEDDFAAMPADFLDISKSELSNSHENFEKNYEKMRQRFDNIYLDLYEPCAKIDSDESCSDSFKLFENKSIHKRICIDVVFYLMLNLDCLKFKVLTTKINNLWAKKYIL